MTDDHHGANDWSAALADVAARFWDSEMASEPVTATALGDRRFDDRLRDNGPGASEAEIARLEAILAEVRAIPATELSTDDRITHDELASVVAAEIGGNRAGLEAWMADPLDGPQVTFQNIPSFQPVRDEHEAVMLLARWREMGPWIDRLVDSSREALARGVGAPAALARSVIDELDGLLARPSAEWPLAAAADELPGTIPTADRERLARDIRAAVEAGIRPAYARYRSFLAEELLPVARGDDRPGLSHVPGGSDAYDALIGYHTTLELTPEAIHQIGLDETERIDAEFRRLGETLLGTFDLAEILRRLREDPDLHFRTPDEVFAVAQATLDRANAAIPDWFGRLPKAPCVVVEMGAHEAEHSTIAYYREPAPDGSRPGRYYINTTKPGTRPRYEAETLAVHEAVPGHHLQIAIAQELDGLPAFRRLGGPTAYVEGWGLYTERLAVEMGLISEGVARLGVASFDAWRACRLVVDTGMHALGWSRDQAIGYMLEHTALADNNIVNEVDRYLAIPGQALAYKLGQLEILRLRDRARGALGEAFDIRAFHDTVLGQGPVALATLGRIVDAWIAGGGARTDDRAPA